MPRALTFTNVQVSQDSFKAHSEPAIAENPANPRNLVAGSKFFTDPAHYLFKIGTYYTMDGGYTWHDTGVLPGFDSYIQVSDVSFAFSPNGSLVYACVLGVIDDSRTGVFVSRSRDGGKTWSQPATVFVDTTGNTFSDKPWIAVDQTNGPNRGNVYVVWNLDSPLTDVEDPGRHLLSAQVDGTPQVGVVFSRSTDYGKTFFTPVTLTPFSGRHFALGAIPAVAPDGRLYVAYLNFQDQGAHTVDSIALTSSSDGGQSFSKPKTAIANVTGLPDRLPQGTFRNLSLPTFAISPRDGSMVLGWADERYGDADILASRSTSRGASWSAPVRVNHDPVKDGKDQFQPEVAVAPNGIFTMSWFDRRYDPDNRLIDVDVAQSATDGLTFGHNIRVTKKSWDPAIDAPKKSGDTFIGDYQALAVDNTTVHPLWNDTQNGASQEIRTSVIAETVFTRR